MTRSAIAAFGAGVLSGYVGIRACAAGDNAGLQKEALVRLLAASAIHKGSSAGTNLVRLLSAEPLIHFRYPISET